MEVISRSSDSAELCLNTSKLGIDNYNVTCTSSTSLRNHLVTILDVTFSENISQLTVQPLAPSTNYTCCLDCCKPTYCSDSFVTESLAGGLSRAVAGVLGGVVGAVVTLLLIAGITGIVIGTALLLRRKR